MLCSVHYVGSNLPLFLSYYTPSGWIYLTEHKKLSASLVHASIHAHLADEVSHITDFYTIDGQNRVSHHDFLRVRDIDPP